MDETLIEMLRRVRRVEGRVEGLEKLGRGGQRVVVTMPGTLADAAAVDAAFLAAAGVDARNGDALVAFLETDGVLVVLIKKGTGWEGVEVEGRGVSYE